MDLNTNLLYQVNLIIFLLFTYSHTGTSTPVSDSKINNALDAIAICDSVKFLRDSSYVRQCNTLSYPIEFHDKQADNDIRFMCMTLNHITKKICEYHDIDMSQMKIPESAKTFDEELKKLEPKHNEIINVVDGWCKNMTTWLNVTIQNDNNVFYINYANETLLDKIECVETCHVRHGVNNFCVVFFWFNKLHNRLQLSKKNNILKETPVSKQETLPKIDTDDNIEKPLSINPDNKDEHTSVVNTKVDNEHSKFPNEIQSNLKSESIGSANEQEVKKNLDQPDQEIMPDREQQKQDSKLSSLVDDKLNIIENRAENIKTEFQEGNSFLDEEGKKGFEEGIEGENDHSIMETNKKDSYNDSGDQHGFLESPVIKEEDESHFFIYFSILSLVCLILYIGYHNKQKILAIVLEGRQSKRNRGSRRRPNTANYRKLDSNLEEAVTSQCSTNVTHVIY
ncbi:trans-Golgi network integral membrane protein 2-like [Phymastichus coffea]|uniref:trans-Golgi network integral membrane protein 2-like n=1 Tax=Phymastichus coffea TaxID=108790 RepID=UPI00273AEDF9|nr:trans-Golgi network integral membrane protein 2-like [Phymastichus coffea]